MGTITGLDELREVLRVDDRVALTISDAISKVPSDVRTTWLDGLVIRDGSLVGTRYAEVGSHLSFNDFCGLYESLGYDLKLMGYWKDYLCAAAGCEAASGYTCNPDNCR